MKQRHSLLLLTVLLLALATGSQPLAAQDSTERCFPETGQCITGTFKAFWERNGGLAAFGYPISGTGLYGPDNKPVFAQWFERSRFELHPENDPPYNVLLGQLGFDDKIGCLHSAINPQECIQRSDPSQPHYFAETGYAVYPDFWENFISGKLDLGEDKDPTRRAIALTGYPTSIPMMVTGEDGVPRITQWFERARLEWHGDVGTLRTRLGAKYYFPLRDPPGLYGT